MKTQSTGGTMARRVPPTLTMPHGTGFDPELTVQENARAAWENALDLIRSQTEASARMALRKVFGPYFTDIGFEYRERFPRVPFMEVGDDLLAFKDHSLQLVEMCGSCGNDFRGWAFTSLAGFGESLTARDAEPESFVCRTCQYLEALQDMKSKRK